MSDSASGPEPPARPRPARWLDRAMLVLVAASVAGATAAATPSILRAAGVVGPPAPELVLSPHPTSARPLIPPRSTSYAFEDHPQFAPDDDPPRITQLERELMRGQPGEVGPDPDIFAPTRSQAGVARSPLTVRERADIASKITGRVPAGTPVRLLLEKGEWALIAYRTAETAVVGWTARSAVITP